MNDLRSQFSTLPLKNAHSSDITTLAAVEDALRVRAAYSIYVSVLQGIAKHKDSVKGKILYNEMYQQEQVTFSTYHLMYYTIWAARGHLSRTTIACPKLRKHLESLVTLHGLIEIQKDMVPLLECGYYTPKEIHNVNEAIKLYVKALRPQHISLVEAFDIPDSVLNSAIGNRFGDIYE